MEFQGQTLGIIGGNNQSTTVNTAFSDALEVGIQENVFNNPLSISGVNITFTIPTSSAGVQEATQTITSNSSGIVSLSVTANTTSGSHSIIASSTGFTSQTFNLTNNPDVTSQFILSGFLDPITAGIQDNFTVEAQDQFGNLTPAYSDTVAFSSSDIQAVLPTNSMLTSGMGTFNATLKTSGEQSITATDTVNMGITGSQLDITVNPDVAASLSIIGGNSQSTTVNTAFGNALEVEVKDKFGNLVPNANLTFTVPTSDAGVQEATQNVTTDANGIASLNVTANDTAGIFSIFSSGEGLDSVEFSLTNIAETTSTTNNTQTINNPLDEIEGGQPNIETIVVENENENQEDSQLLICVEANAFDGKVPLPSCGQ